MTMYPYYVRLYKMKYGSFVEIEAVYELETDAENAAGFIDSANASYMKVEKRFSFTPVF